MPLSGHLGSVKHGRVQRADHPWKRPYRRGRRPLCAECEDPTPRVHGEPCACGHTCDHRHDVDPISGA